MNMNKPTPFDGIKRGKEALAQPTLHLSILAYYQKARTLADKR